MHFTPPEETLAEAFNITWDPEAWGMEEDTHIYASFPEYQNPAISTFRLFPAPCAASGRLTAQSPCTTP